MTLPTVVLALAFVGWLFLIAHAIRRAGTPVSGVPHAVWLIGLVSLDLFAAALYLVFVVVGAVRTATWRHRVVYAVLLLSLLGRVWPLSVPEVGRLPGDSARASSWFPDLLVAGDLSQFGTSSWQTSSAGRGLCVHSVLVVSDSDPVAAAAADVVGRAIAGIDGVENVDFAQRGHQAPVEVERSPDLVVSVAVHGTVAFDFLLGAVWDGKLEVIVSETPWANDPNAMRGQVIDDRSRVALSSTYQMRGMRVGAAWGAARYDFVSEPLTKLGDHVSNAFREASFAAPIRVNNRSAFGTWRAAFDHGVLRPFETTRLLVGAGFLHDAHSVWEVDFGENPAEGLAQLRASFEANGWRVNRTSADESWLSLRAVRERDGGRQEVFITPSQRELHATGALDFAPVLISAGTDFSEPKPKETPRRYIVDAWDRFGKERMRALVEACLDSDDDFDLLRILGRDVPDERYDEWRQLLLAGDLSVATLLATALQDRRRDQLERGQAAVQVARWMADWHPRDLEEARDEVKSAAKILKFELNVNSSNRADAPSLAELEAAGIPLLGSTWRRVPDLVTPRTFLLTTADGEPVPMTVEAFGQSAFTIRHARRGGGRTVTLAEDAEPSVFETNGGRFEMRLAPGGHHEVRWVLQ